jgi:hypothetical protein
MQTTPKGDIIKNPFLANTYKKIAVGRDAFIKVK